MTPQQTQALWAKFDDAWKTAESPDTKALIIAMRAMTEIVGHRLVEVNLAMNTRNSIAQAQLAQSQKAK